MTDFIKYIGEFNFAAVLIRLLAAVVLGGLIGLERGRHGSAAGLRTHIVVCIGATITSLTGVYLNQMGYGADVTRLSAQVISGIGFLGAGMILIRGNTVIKGLTTAAGMWATAAIGVALGYGFYVGAVISTLLCIFCVVVLAHFERRKRNTLDIYIEINDIKQTQDVVHELKQNGFLESFDIIPAKSGITDNVGVICTLVRSEDYEKIKVRLRENDRVVMVLSGIGI